MKYPTNKIVWVRTVIAWNSSCQYKAVSQRILFRISYLNDHTYRTCDRWAQISQNLIHKRSITRQLPLKSSIIQTGFWVKYNPKSCFKKLRIGDWKHTAVRIQQKVVSSHVNFILIRNINLYVKTQINDSNSKMHPAPKRPWTRDLSLATRVRLSTRVGKNGCTVTTATL